MATIPERFKVNVVSLLDMIDECFEYLRSQGQNIPLTGVVIRMAKSKVASEDAVELIDGFIKKSPPYWETIRTRDETHLSATLGSIIAQVPDFAKGMLASTISQREGGGLIIPSETLESIWGFLESFVTLSIKYVHERRVPQVVDGKMKYTVDYGGDLVVSELHKLWKDKM